MVRVAEGDTRVDRPLLLSFCSFSLCQSGNAMRGERTQREHHPMNKTRLIILPLLAAAGQPMADTLTSEPMLVTATRTEQAAATSLATVTIIDRQTIEQSQSLDVAELLRSVAGIDIARNGGPGQSTSFFIRGTESNHAVVLIDGVKINPGTIGQPAIQNIDTAMIERIEIVKGPRSTLYGSDAIGGVINIITRRDDRLAVSAMVGSFATRKLNATLGQKRDDLYYGFDIGLSDTNGFPTRTTSTVDSGFDNTNVNAYLGTRQSWGSLELRHWQATGTYDYLSFSLLPVNQDYTNSSTALSNELFVTDIWTSKLTLSHIEDHIEQNQSSDFVRTRRNALDWQNDIELDRHLVSAGITLWREQAKAISFGSPYSADTDTNEVFIQDDIDLGRHKLLAGLRYTDHETAGSNTTWNLGYGLQLNDASFLYANAGTAFRAPDATDRFGFGGNPNLRPETSRSWELGLRHQFTPALKGSLAVFNNDIDNLITFPAPSFTATNIGKANIRGLEATLDFRQGPWEGDLSASIQNPRDKSNDSQLLRRAKRSLDAHLNYTWQPGARIGAELLAQSARHDIDATTFAATTNPGYAIFNLTADYRLAPAWILAARVENLADRDYVLVNGFRTQERSAYLTLTYQPGNRD